LKRLFETGVWELRIMAAEESTRIRLLEAAGEEFAEKGFEAARIRVISLRARANVAAVNYYFGDKRELYIQAVLHAHQCGVHDGGEEVVSEMPPAEQLRRFIHDFLSHVLAVHNPDGWQHRLILREMLHPTAASDVLIREAIRPKFERLQRILQRFCPAADARQLNALTFSVIGQCLHYRMARAMTERLIGERSFQALDLDYLTDHITTFSLAAIGAVPAVECADQTTAEPAVATGSIS
jgi:AcrR family transcriptional regulator